MTNFGHKWLILALLAMVDPPAGHGVPCWPWWDPCWPWCTPAGHGGCLAGHGRLAGHGGRLAGHGGAWLAMVVPKCVHGVTWAVRVFGTVHVAGTPVMGCSAPVHARTLHARLEGAVWPAKRAGKRVLVVWIRSYHFRCHLTGHPVSPHGSYTTTSRVSKRV